MTTSTPHEDQLSERLHSLTDTIDGPLPTTAVVRRGRAGVRRKRVIGTAAALSVLATAGVLGATSGVLSHSGRTQHLGGAAGSPQTSVAPTKGHHGSKHAAKKADKQPAVETWCNHVGPQRAREEDRRYGSTRDGYADLVIEHLDPHQLHLHKSEGGETRTGRNCALYALGTELGYTSPGNDGLGVVAVYVTTKWSDPRNDSEEPGWQQVDSPPSGAVRAYVRHWAGVTSAAVTRIDGTTVELVTNPLWGNNSLIPVKSMDLTTGQLLATAADPRFEMP